MIVYRWKDVPVNTILCLEKHGPKRRFLKDQNGLCIPLDNPKSTMTPESSDVVTGWSPDPAIIAREAEVTGPHMVYPGCKDRIAA